LEGVTHDVGSDEGQFIIIVICQCLVLPKNGEVDNMLYKRQAVERFIYIYWIILIKKSIKKPVRLVFNFKI
jgi:hypothetical protein